MKLVVEIDAALLADIEQEAGRRGCTVSELVEVAIRTLLTSQDSLRPLPSFHSGGTLVDIANRDALYQVMDER